MKKTWRLSKTLARRTEVRPIENEDVKFAWAAYKNGALDAMGLPQGLDAAGFKSEFERYVLTNTPATWTIITETKNGFIPSGFVFGQLGAFLTIVGIAWCPWASKRNIIEGAVRFFNRIRREMPWIGFAADEHKAVYEVCMQHGIMSRIGTSHSLGKRMAVFEGRK